MFAKIVLLRARTAAPQTTLNGDSVNITSGTDNNKRLSGIREVGGVGQIADGASAVDNVHGLGKGPMELLAKVLRRCLTKAAWMR